MSLSVIGWDKKQLSDHKLTEKGLNKIVNINFHYQSLKCLFNFKSKYPENIQDILNEYIFFNRYITIDDNMIQPRDLVLTESSLKFRMIDPLSQNKVMTCEELHSQPSWNTNILHINSLLTAIPKCWKDKINSDVIEFQGRPCFGLVISKQIMPITKVTSRKVYWDVVNEKNKRPTVLET